jgi:hypothetical protein
MSGQCQAPGTDGCGLKNYEQCKISEESNAAVCRINGITVTKNAECNPNSGSAAYTRTQVECNVGSDQRRCEDIDGCKWDYTLLQTDDSPLSKGCKLVGDGSPTSCANFHESRYGLVSGETFGCDKDYCTYVPQEKARVNGTCVRSNMSDGASECINSITSLSLEKTECITNEKCVWVANDEAHCGYHRNVEHYLEEISATEGGESNIKKLDSITIGAIDTDPCLRIKFPGRESCEGQGCVWDIYGNRDALNTYNGNGNGVNVNQDYYDISTSGLCKMPITVACMGHFCHKQSGEAYPNMELPDGKCEYDRGAPTMCKSSSKEIVTYRTPGLIDFMPISGFEAISKQRNFHTDPTALSSIIEVNNLLGVKYKELNALDNTYPNNSSKKAAILLESKEIYKENCELNIDYPSSPRLNNFVRKHDEYDIDTDTCSFAVDGTNIGLSSRCIDPDNFYHKYSDVTRAPATVPPECKMRTVFADTAKVRTRFTDVVARSPASVIVLASTFPLNDKRLYETTLVTALGTEELGIIANAAQPTATNWWDPANAADDITRTNNNITCRMKFFEIVGKLEGYIGTYITAPILPPSDNTGVTALLTSIANQVDNDNGTGDDLLRPDIRKSIVSLGNGTEDCIAILGTAAEETAATTTCNLDASTNSCSKVGGSGECVYTPALDLSATSKIATHITNLSNQLTMGKLSADEYKNSVAIYLASLIKYDSSITCVYNPVAHEYVDGSVGSSNFSPEFYQYLAEELPISNTSNLIADLHVENIEKTLKVKDMTYQKGNAVVTLQLYNSQGKKIEITETNYTGVGSGEYPDSADFSSLHPYINNSASDPTGKYANLFDSTIHQIVPGTHKLYVGGMLEFEIDNVDPGCFDYDPSGGNRHECQKHITLEGLDGLYQVFNHKATSIGGGSGDQDQWRVKEVRFKDVPIDIYFQGDIDGLFKVNDLISIKDNTEPPADDTHSIVNIFNKNNKYQMNAGTAVYYQKVINVDIVDNKIRVENAKRRGPYFIGRADLEEQYHGDAKSCITDPSYGKLHTALEHNAASLDYCDFRELYEYCKGQQSDCAAEPLCEISPSGNADDVCIPNYTYLGMNVNNYAGTTVTSGLGAVTDNFRCNETNGIKIPLQKTKCPVVKDGGTDDRTLQYEDMTRGGGTGIGLVDADFLPVQASNNSYTIPRLHPDVDLAKLEKEDTLKNWRVKYISKSSGTTIEIKEGIIEKHYVIGDSSPIHKIKIKQKDSSDETSLIYILSFRPPYIYDYLENPSNVENTFDIKVGIFVRKGSSLATCTETAGTSNANDLAACTASGMDLSSSAACAAVQLDGSSDGTSPACTYAAAIPSTTTTKQKCDFNNGEWDNYECAIQGPYENIRSVDLCERTGFIFDKKTNVCYKEISDVMTYCNEKNDRSTDFTIWDSSDPQKNPCGVCNFHTTTDNTEQYCEPLDRSLCTGMTESECDASKSCEYYRDNMDDEIVTKRDGTIITESISKNAFTCSDGGGDYGCSGKNTESICEGPTGSLTGCEWTCPYIQNLLPIGYHVSAGGIEPNPTPLNDRSTNNYYNPDSITVTCDTDNGWEPVGTGMPKAQCERNADDNSYTNHNQVIKIIGCVKTLNCKNTEYLAGNLSEMMVSSPLSVPDNFKTDNEIDRDKFPTANGSFNCPAPKSLISSPETVVGWDIDTCCKNVGLCTGNENINDNVTCPPGQEIKMTYYESSDELVPAEGTTVTQCCVSPEEPTVTVPLDADYSELIGSDGSIESEGFRENFIADLIEILNASSHTTVVILPEMIDIINIAEGSILVTFKIKKNISGEVILKEQISKTLLAGTSFTRSGGTMKGVATFKRHDPTAKYLYYSDKYKTGITPEELAISIFVTFSLCFFCLVVLGMLFK